MLKSVIDIAKKSLKQKLLKPDLYSSINVGKIELHTVRPKFRIADRRCLCSVDIFL